MAHKEYKILEATLCIYCNRSFSEPKRLQTHVLRQHKGTYPAQAILRSRAACKN